MSCTVSHELSKVMLAELLLSEKDATRVWLLSEMDRLVDPLLDTLFNKLHTKLANGLERTQSGDGGDCAQVNHDDQLCPPPNQLHQSSFVIAQPSTSSHLMPHHQNVHYSYQQPNDPIHCNLNSNQQSQLSSLVQSTIYPNVQVNFDAILNEPSIQNFDEDAGECYCDECLGAIEIDDEVGDDDDSDSVQCIEDEQEDRESSRPVKRPRIESTQPNNALPEVTSQSKREPTCEAQPNQVTKQYITVHLHCPLSECPDTFTEDQLNQHMLDKHDIGPNRCLVKDCAQAFENRRILRQHIKQSHQHSTHWHCGKCSKHFANYKLLSIHYTQQHQLGLFQCSYPSCTFTGEYKMKVFNHHRQHKVEFVCSQTGCNYRTYHNATLKAHERAHLGIKPYRCKWLNCGYSSSYHPDAWKHIRSHLAGFQSPNQTVAHSVDPRDYLEVASELL